MTKRILLCDDEILKLVERLRQHPATAALPVLMLTAKGYELAPADLAEKWNVLEVIAKPFSPRELLQKVENVLAAACP